MISNINKNQDLNLFSEFLIYNALKTGSENLLRFLSKKYLSPIYMTFYNFIKNYIPYNNLSYDETYNMLNDIIINKNLFTLEDILIPACREGNFKIVKYAIENGINIHFKNDFLLVTSEYMGYYNIVEYLLNNGANIHIKNDQCLIQEIENNNFKRVKYLIFKGADINANKGEPMTTAIICNNLNIVKYLISKGANTSDNYERYLSLTLFNGYPNIFKYLYKNPHLAIKDSHIN